MSELLFSSASSGSPETKTTVLTSVIKSRPIKISSRMVLT